MFLFITFISFPKLLCLEKKKKKKVTPAYEREVSVAQTQWRTERGLMEHMWNTFIIKTLSFLENKIIKKIMHSLDSSKNKLEMS